ncbi:MAG: ribonuclease III [Salibacteraceae bacterium]
MSFLSRFSKSKLSTEDQDLVSYIKSLTGYKPKTLQLYVIALTHQSHSEKYALGYNNERLEFLGDAVLDLVISDVLYNTYPSKNEGELTQLRSAIVNRKSLGKIAMSIELVSRIRTEVNLTQQGVSLPGNALEALIGAVYLDLGYEKVAGFIKNVLLSKHFNVKKALQEHENHKSKLLEWSQKEGTTIEFLISQKKEPEKTFCAELKIDGLVLGTGEGRSKKVAEQKASLEALKAIGVK